MVYYAPVAPQRATSVFERWSLRRAPTKRAAPATTGASGRGAGHEMDACSGARNSKTQELSFSESLILAQNERWQRGLGMQVERDPGGSNIPW